MLKINFANPTKRHCSQQHLHLQAFHGNLTQTRTRMAVIPRFLPLKNTTPHSILSPSTSTLKTLLNPLHHHPLFPSQNLLSPVPKKTYSISCSNSNHDMYSVLPFPLTLAHRMSLRFTFPKKDKLKEMVKVDPNAVTATVFLVFVDWNKRYKAKIGDGEDGGGIVLNNVAWGQRALHLAQDVLSQFGNDFKVYAFKATPDGYIQILIESFSDEYGCPSLKMLLEFYHKYRHRLLADGASGMLPDDWGLVVGSPGLERLLKVPDDPTRFKGLPMRVSYEESDGKERDWVFFLCSVEEGYCVWDLSDFDPMNKDRAVSRREGSWSLKLPFEAHKRVVFFIQPPDIDLRAGIKW